MRYRVVRRPGENGYLVQWSVWGIFRGYEKDYSHRLLVAAGIRPNRYFTEHHHAQAHIDSELEKQRDKGQKWPWQPTYYP